MRTWKKALSKDLKEELIRLRNGNADERQRYKNAEEAISRTLVDPVHVHKHSLGDYKAVNVLAQYRVFYEIIDDHNIVHFVWINDHTCKHDNSKNPDPCYDKFISLVNTGKIPKFVPSKKTKGFTLNGEWGYSSQIYAEFHDEDGKANSYLTMQHQKADNYQIIAIGADRENVGLEKLLLKELVKSAKAKKISLYFELDLTRDEIVVEALRLIFEKCGFIADESDGELELWILD